MPMCAMLWNMRCSATISTASPMKLRPDMVTTSCAPVNAVAPLWAVVLRALCRLDSARNCSRPSSSESKLSTHPRVRSFALR